MGVVPGYKLTDIGPIPDDWEVIELGTHARFRTGPFGSALHKSDYVRDGIPVINPMQIVDGRIHPSPLMAISSDAARSLADFQLLTGDVIIGRRGEMGRCAHVNAGQHGWLCGTGSMIIRPDDSINARFLQRLLSSRSVTAAIESTSVGTTMVNLNQATLRDLQVAIPPTTAEQEAIAEALDDADAHIEALEQLIAKKRAVKQGAMLELLTGRRRLPGFSREWETKPFGALFNFSGGLSASRAQLSSEGHLYLHYGDIHGSTKSFIDVEAERDAIPRLNVPLAKVSRTSLLDDGDVVFVDASEDDEGTSKHVVILNTESRPFISGLHTIVAKAKGEDIDKTFRRFCFQSENIRSQFHFFAVGTKVSGISKTNIAKIDLSFPPVPEQKAIASILSDMDAELDILESRLAKARLIKDGMMQELLTGKTRLV